MIPAKRSQLLDAAQKRFSYYGVSKVTMDEIAADVGLSKAAVYYYFKTKEDVYREVVAREIALFCDQLATIVRSADTASNKLASYVRLRFACFDELQNLRKVSVDSEFDFGKHLGGAVRKHMIGRERKLVTAIVQAGMDDGEFDGRAPATVAELLQHLLQGLVIWRAKRQPDLRGDAFVGEDKLLAQVLLNGLLSRPPGRSPRRKSR